MELKSVYLSSGYEVQTVRITTDILEKGRDIVSLSSYQAFMQQLEANKDVFIYHLGSVSDEKVLGQEEEKILVGLFLKNKKAFVAIDAGSSNISSSLCFSGARICKLIAEKDPFECRRFAVYAGVTQSTPFYPASRVFSNSMKISVGCQSANLAVEEAVLSSKDISVFEKRLKERMEGEYAQIERLIPAGIQPDFLGFDTSLAPFPATEHSIANAIEIILGKPFGSSGTLSVVRVLTRVMQENAIKKTGLCGLMLPVVEDNVLAQRGIEGNYTWKELLLFSAVCATGLDTVPISGKTTISDLADCYHDLATLAVKLKKPLSARIFIEPGKMPGETIKYDWEFACESPVFKI